MDTVLEVSGLCKRYPGFTLDNVSFSLEKGHIMGFLGRNGAGKTTTMKAILGLVHKDGGSIHILDKNVDEADIRAHIGYASGGAAFYPRKTVAQIAAMTKRFYPHWDEAAFTHYLQVFRLDTTKHLQQLSDGMKVKFQLALALSHGAQLLILDEPSSGLDPVSRAELKDIFRQLAAKGTAILFSTHITTDLLDCADDITYIQKGSIVASKPMGAFLADYPDCRDMEAIMVRLEKEDIAL